MNTDREHLDAETVAAWIDGGLDAAALAAAEAHASNCDRCQTLLATVARTLPADAGSVPSAAVSHARRIWYWWMAPIAATAAAVTLWMVVPQDAGPAAEKSAQSDAALAPAAPSPVAPIAPPVIPERAAKSVAPAGRDSQAPELRREAPKENASAKTELADAQANTSAEAFSERKREGVREELAKAAPAAPLPTTAAPAEPARDTAARGDALGAAAQSRLLKQAAPLQIVAPDTERRWRVLPDTIEHSQDGGRSWIPVRLTAGDVITAGASPSAQVCWLVGTGGLVLLATDGTNFTRLPFPERVDLVAITSTDARRATVTAADGRTFHTDDNGRNWRNP